MLNTVLFKKVRRRSVAAGVLALAALSLAAQAAVAEELPLSGRSLADALRRGGYVIYFRHAGTDWSQDDQVAVDGDWKSCDSGRMRQLSDQGRKAARSIGEAFRRLQIPVGRVLSSEYCRARQTAELMNLGPVAPTRAIMNMLVADMVGGRAAVIERARRELGRLPEAGTNTVIVAHGNLMRAATGEYTAEAGAAVFRPLGDIAFERVALIAPEDWQQLAARFAED
jgi:broad specificity phosphatase PhoE